MSRAVNKAILLGRLGADPEIRYTSSGTAVVNVSLATNESYTNREGERIEKTEWHRLVFWRQLAEIAGQYLRKGSSVYVEGTLRYRTWEDQEGKERFTTEIEVMLVPPWVVRVSGSRAIRPTRITRLVMGLLLIVQSRSIPAANPSRSGPRRSAPKGNLELVRVVRAAGRKPGNTAGPGPGCAPRRGCFRDRFA